MLHVETHTLGPLATNAYILTGMKDGQAIVIDPGMEPGPLLQALDEQNLNVSAILLTHTHFDHIGGVQEVRTKYQCPVYVHEQEADWLENPELNGSLRWPDVCQPMSLAPAEQIIREEGTLQVAGLSFQVLHTPGHSPGSVSYVYEGHCFSGDVLFKQSVGRTDLPGGSSIELYTSIHEQLFRLPSETLIYPGHGPITTVVEEKNNNPFV